MRKYSCIRSLVYFIGCIITTCSCNSLENWPFLSDEMVAAVRTQRDISDVITLDQLTRFGISLNAMVFDKYGYSEESSANISSILYVGARVLMLDVYWNEFTSRWQLCPAPFPSNSSTDVSKAREVSWDGSTYTCQPQFNIYNVMNIIKDYFEETNTNLEVDYIHMVFNVKSISYPPNSNNTHILQELYSSSPFSSLGNSSLNDTVISLRSLIFTPLDLLKYKQQQENDYNYRTRYNSSDFNFPSLESFLYTSIKRSTIVLNTNDFKNKTSRAYNFTNNDYELYYVVNEDFSPLVISSDDEDYIERCNALTYEIGSEEESEQAFEKVSNTTQFRIVIDNDLNPFTSESFRSFLKCGFAPILNASEYEIDDDDSRSLGPIMNYFTNMSLWFWSPGQPKKIMTYASNDTDSMEVAYRCGALDETGVRLANCYEKYPYACQKNNSPYEWKISSQENKSYFGASNDEVCPSGYSLGIPLSSLQILSLYDAIDREGIEYPVWVDINDITVENCFVTNGPYASCPYQKTYTRSKLIGLIAPAFFVSVFLLFLIALGKIFRVHPIQTNRKRYWKKVIREYNARNEYEGVPS